MTSIQFVKGDATSPQATGNKLVVHICNDLGKWGKGFVLAVSARWLEPEKAYRDWSGNDDFKLGAVQFVQVAPDIWVANMVGQHGIRKAGKTPPIRYEAVEQCLATVAQKAQELNASVHMPRIGCGLAGGSWETIESLIARTLCEAGVSVTVYDL